VEADRQGLVGPAELAVQSSSETLDDDERAYIQDEYIELADEIARISSVTQFNGVSLTDNSSTSIEVQVGIQDSADSRISISLIDLRATTLGVDAGALDLSTSSDAQAAITALDTALDSVNEGRASLGAVQNRLDSALNNSQVFTEANSAARSRIEDTDFAAETSNLTKLQIMQQAGVAALAQAKNVNQSVVSLLS
jgi:flagellin